MSNYRMTEREARYLKRIQELVNDNRAKHAKVNHLQRHLNDATATVRSQRTTLCAMNVQAEARNTKIASLLANNSVTVTPTPVFEENEKS